MKKNNFTGWKDVFWFTLSQNFKSKSTIITTAIFLVIAIASLPVMSMINGNGSVSPSSIKNIAIINNTDIDLTESIGYVLGEHDQYKKIEYTIADTDKETEEEKLNSDDKAKSDMLMVFDYDEEKGFSAQFEYGEKTDISRDDAENYISDFEMEFGMIMANSLGITEEQLDAVNQSVDTEVKTYDQEDINENGDNEEKDSDSDMNKYSVVLFMITVMVFMVAISGEGVAGVIITEKTSKIVEYLLTSIKPMAIIIGKVIAVFATTVIEILIFVIGFVLSYLLNDVIYGSFSSKNIPANLKGVLNTDVLSGLNAVNIIIALVVLLMGILFYEMLGGLVGSTVNKLEEMAEGMKIYTFTMLIGAYLGIGLAMAYSFDSCPAALMIGACIFPISAPFCLPGFMMVGEIGLLPGAIAVICMALSLALITIFTSNVYEEIIYHNGEKLKISDVIRIYKNNKKGVQ